MNKETYNWGGANTATILANRNLCIKKEVIQPDSGEHWHFHKKAHQWFLFLKGDLIIETQARKFHLKEETCVSISPLVAHKVWNTSTEPVVFYLISSNNSVKDKFLLEYQYPACEELSLNDTLLTISFLEHTDSEQLAKVLLKNKTQLLPHFPTSFKILDNSTKCLVKELRSLSIFPFGVFESGSLIGYLSIKNHVKHTQSCELAYWLNEAHQHKGIMYHALKKFIMELILNYGFRNFTARVAPNNKSSIALLSKLGFKKQQDMQQTHHLSAKKMIQRSASVKIYTHTEERSAYFKSLNEEWIGELFEIEAADSQVLNHPKEKIILAGGEIFYVELNGEIVSTGAIMPLANGEFELTKMASTKKYQGLGLGELVMQEAIKWGKHKGIDSMILYTQSTLFKALNLYKKYGFKKEEPGHMHYQRADIKMRLQL